MPIFDTHAHYDDEAFDADRTAVLEHQKQNGVEFILNCCASLESLTRVPQLAHEQDFMYFAAGLHPENLEGADDSALQRIASLLQDPKCLAVGEIVMNELKKLDEVAYVRFASVYRQFKDIQTFMNELSKLLTES